MLYRRTVNIIVAGVLMLLASCSNGNHDDKQQEAAEQCALHFSQLYYNLQYENSKIFCTDNSIRELKYAASIITEADVELVRQQEQGADVEVTGFEWLSDADTAAIVEIEVHNVFIHDSVQLNGHIAESKTFRLKATRAIDNKEWRIDLASSTEAN